MDGYNPPNVEPGEPARAEDWNELVDSVITSVKGDGYSILASRFGNTVVLRAIQPDTKPTFALLNGKGQSTGTFTGQECDAVGNTLANGREWDSANSSVLPDVHLQPGKYGPRWNKPIEVRYAVVNGSAYWYAVTQGPFPAIITGNTDLRTYAWSEAEFSGTSLSAMTGGRSGTGATNMLAVNHTSAYKWGVDTSATDYSGSNFAARPVGGGGTDNTHKYDVPVWMYEVIDDADALNYYFVAMGSHDGGCG